MQCIQPGYYCGVYDYHGYGKRFSVPNLPMRGLWKFYFKVQGLEEICTRSTTARQLSTSYPMVLLSYCQYQCSPASKFTRANESYSSEYFRWDSSQLLRLLVVCMLFMYRLWGLQTPYNGAYILLWSQIEINAAIISASVPSLKPLFKRIRSNGGRYHNCSYGRSGVSRAETGAV